MAKVVYSIVLIAVLAGCDGPAERSPEDLVIELMAVWESGETDRLAELMSADVVYAEWTMTAIQSGPIPGRVPVATGKKITTKGATLVRVEAGKITRAADYLDALGFVLQLGGEVALPGDVVLKLPD